MFEKIDTYFEDKTPLHLALTSCIVCTFIFFLVFTYLFKPSKHFLNQNQINLLNITAQLKASKTYLTNHKQNTYMDKKQSEIKQIQKKIDEKKALNTYIDNKLTTLPYLFLSEKKVSNFIHQISTLAKQYTLKIVEISNTPATLRVQALHQILSLHVKTQGDYKGSIGFIDAIEQSPYLVQIDTLTLKATSNFETDINISLWEVE